MDRRGGGPTPVRARVPAVIEFAHPWLLAALPVPWLIWVLRRRIPWDRLRRRTAKPPPGVLHPYAELLHTLADTQGRWRVRAPWLWAVGCALLIAAIARPVWVGKTGPDWHSGRDVMLAVDLSGSMRALDFKVDGKPISRLDMAKRMVDTFLAARQGDRLGLIVFADDAYTLVPMTADLDLVRNTVRHIGQGVIGEKTALGPAIALAVQRLKDRRPAARILVILTDGSDTVGEISPRTATRLAQRYHVRIYTIGVGTNKEVLFPKGPVIPPELTHLPLDEDLLRGIAEQTGGRYFPVERTGDVKNVIQTIDDLETIPIADQDIPDRAEWYWLPLAAGLLLLLAHHLRRPAEALP
jgi:Ca-activated chloride channel family protein